MCGRVVQIVVTLYAIQLFVRNNFKTSSKSNIENLQKLKLRPGSMARQIYDELPFPLILKVYLFNITNPDEVHKGGKPNLQEIGPYTYQ